MFSHRQIQKLPFRKSKTHKVQNNSFSVFLIYVIWKTNHYNSALSSMLHEVIVSANLIYNVHGSKRPYVEVEVTVKLTGSQYVYFLWQNSWAEIV